MLNCYSFYSCKLRGSVNSLVNPQSRNLHLKMAHVEALPPYRHLSSQSISLTDASNMLDKYIMDSESHPHLHPDSIITPTGVTFSAHGGPMGGVVMHNLRRVAAGLHGEYMEPEPTPEPEDGGEQEVSSKGRRKGKHGDTDAAAVANTEDDWMNMSEFEREEGHIEVGDVGPRTNVVQDGGDAPEVEALGSVGAEGTDMKKRKGDGEGKIDKEARKKAKKQRHKEHKAKKEQARADKSK